MILLAFVMMYALFAKKSVNSILLAFLSFFAIGLGIASYTLSKILKSVGMDSIVLQMGYWLQFLVVFISIVILLGVVLLLKRICKYITMKKIYVSFLAFVGIAGCVYVLLWKYTDYVGSYAGRSLVDVQLGSLKAGSMILPAVNSAFGIGKSILGAITDINNPQAAECAIIGVLEASLLRKKIACHFLTYRDDYHCALILLIYNKTMEYKSMLHKLIKPYCNPK